MRAIAGSTSPRLVVRLAARSSARLTTVGLCSEGGRHVILAGK
jgi:hypothetical protein